MALGPAFQIAIDDDAIRRLRSGATVVPSAPAVFRVEGPGAIACLQGLLTNDIEKPGVNSLVYGALLTPKGMIVVDLWALRDDTGVTLLAPREAHEAARALLTRSLPPRLARLTDRTDEWTVAWLLGADAARCAEAAGFAGWPLPGTIGSWEPGVAALRVAGGIPTAWFAAVVLGPEAMVAGAVERLADAQVAVGDTADLEAARILAGWPALGAEIGEKTLPQEVSYDELGGVSYTKGCYTGQETVARVHFRGHPNRELRGLVWEDLGDLVGEDVLAEEKSVGRFTSLVATPTRRFGLAVLRREVRPGTALLAGGRAATVVALPFTPEPTAA